MDMELPRIFRLIKENIMHVFNFYRNKIVVFITISLLLNACIPNAKHINEDCAESSAGNPQQSSIELQPSNSVNVKINIDGTPSMLGFVNIPDSRYIQLLKAIDSAASIAFTSSQVEYYRFGLKSYRLNGQKNSLPAQRPNFYSEGKTIKGDFLDAQLQAAIHKTKNISNELNIIVTDLYQKESSTQDPVIQILKDKYLKPGYAVGILGVKSQFKGTVYDTNLKGDTQRNQTTNNHPFYVIVLGKYANILQYYEKLKDNASFVSDENFIIFSKQLVKDKSRLNITNTAPELPPGIWRIQTANKNGLMVHIKSPESTERLRIKQGYKSDNKIEYEVDYSPLPYTLPISTQDINLPIKSIPLKNQGDETTLQVSNFAIDQNKIKWNITIQPPAKSGIYAFAINVIPEKFLEPTWWTQWNYGENEFDVTKTYNLLPFLKNLGSVTLELVKSSQSQGSSQPAIGRFCYILQQE